jgi:serine/threonine protein kinase
MLYHCCGSRSYCAPEVLDQAGYAFGADVWSCGVALFAMLLGFFPLEEASHADWRCESSIHRRSSLHRGTAHTHNFHRRCTQHVWSCGVALFATLLGFFPLEEASHADWRCEKVT